MTAQTVRETVAGHAQNLLPTTLLLGQLDATALELVSQELSVYKAGILHIVLSLRLKF